MILASNRSPRLTYQPTYSYTNKRSMYPIGFAPSANPYLLMYRLVILLVLIYHHCI